MNATSITSTKLLTASGFLSFFVFGFIDNLKGPLLPEVLRDSRLSDGGLSYGQGGSLLSASYVGFIVGTLLTGILSDWISNRRVLMLASFCLCAAILGLNATTSFSNVALCMGFVGVGLGAIEVGGNGLMVELHSVARARYLNLLAACHGVGSLLVPFAAAWLLAEQFRWPQIYLCSGIFALLLATVCMATSQAPDSTTAHKATWNWGVVLRDGFTWRMCWFYVLIAAYVAVELGIAAWMVEYLQQIHGMSAMESALYLSGFFVLLMLGRLAGSFAAERWDYFGLTALALSGTLLCLTIGIHLDGVGLLFLPISGLFMSIVFPTVTAAASRIHQSNVGSILGILFTFAGVGGAFGPWMIGVVSGRWGLRMGLSTSLAICLISLVALAVAARSDDRYAHLENARNN